MYPTTSPKEKTTQARDLACSPATNVRRQPRTGTPTPPPPKLSLSVAHRHHACPMRLAYLHMPTRNLASAILIAAPPPNTKFNGVEAFELRTYLFDNRRSIKDASKANVPPIVKANHAPCHCHNKPIINEDGNANKPIVAFNKP